MPRSALSKILSAAITKQADRQSPWAVVYGPAAAYLASARRLGWIVTTALSATTDEGVVLDYTKDSPAQVARAVQQSVIKWRWRRVEDKHPSLKRAAGGFGAHMAPLFQLLNSKKIREEWTPQAKGGLVSAITNRQWTQARLYQAKLTTTHNCRLCVAMGLCDPCDPDPKHRGSLVHRYWICPVLHPLRQRMVSPKLLQAARNHIAADGTMIPAKSLYFCRALRKALKVQAQKPDESFQWVVRPPRGFSLQSHSIYIDGSLLYSEARYCGLAARRGFAIAIYDSLDQLVAVANGRPPQSVFGIHGAELWGLLQALQLGPLDCKLHTDCMAVLLGAKRGGQWANDPRRTFASVWGPIAAHFGGDAQSLRWGPAHLTGDQVAGRKLSDGTPMRQRHRIGNDLADLHAKEAAVADKLPVRTLKWIEATSDEVLQLALWIGKCTEAANRFRDPRVCPEAKAVFLRDSEGLATSRLCRYKADRKRKATVELIRPGDLSRCPRWQAVRQRLLAKEALARDR